MDQLLLELLGEENLNKYNQTGDLDTYWWRDYQIKN